MNYLLFSRIILTVILLFVFGFFIHRVWTREVDLIGGFKKWANIIPVKDEDPQIVDKHKPLFEIKLFPKTNRVKNPNGTYTTLPTPYPPPLLEYIFVISDKNKESSYVQDFRLNFYFPHKINEIISQAMLFDG